MKVTVDTQEWYPVLRPNEDDSSCYELPDELVNRFENNLREFNSIQEEITRLMDAQL